MNRVKQVLINRVKLHWAIYLIAWALTSPILANEVTVSPGDTLWSLAKNHGTSVSLLKTFNMLDSDEIIPGMVLKIPIAGEVRTESNSGKEINKSTFNQISPSAGATKDIVLSLYRVNRGDNLLDIAMNHDTTVEILKTLNGLSSDIVQTGVILVLPQNTKAVIPTVDDTHYEKAFIPETILPPAHASSGTNEAHVLDPETITSGADQINANRQNAHNVSTYLVKRGDTLYDIANYHGTTVKHLIAVNGLQSDLINPGDQLNLDYPLIEHRVENGENLADIAKTYGTTLDLLLEINRLEVDIVNPGTVLTIPSPVHKTHTVIDGDTLYDIAMAHSISVEDLIKVNDLSGSVIRPGQVLILSSTQTGTRMPLEVTVNTGDTVWEIAQAHHSTVSAIALANNLTDTSLIRPGDTLKIPGASKIMLSTQTTPNHQTIIIQKGDTLSEIAQRFNTTVPTLISTNQLSSDQIVIGQIITISPGDGFRLPETTSNSLTLSNETNLVWPLIGPITSRFGYRQLRLSGTNWHSGLDIDGVTGDPIRAATSGVVSYSGWRGGYGNLVIVTAENTEYYYAHASTLHVSQGDSVKTGQLLARVGSTGRTTGSHLHFEVRINGTPVDPLRFLEATASQ